MAIGSRQGPLLGVGRRQGADCVIARRARVTEPIEGWSGPDGEAFAQACHDRLGARLVLATEPSVREHLTNYQWAVNWHIERKAIAMAGYVSALGLAQLAKDETTIDAYRRERAWQSEWLVRALRFALTPPALVSEYRVREQGTRGRVSPERVKPSRGVDVERRAESFGSPGAIRALFGR